MLCGTVAPSLTLLPASLLLLQLASAKKPALPRGVDGPRDTSLGANDGQAGNAARADLPAASISRPSICLLLPVEHFFVCDRQRSDAVQVLSVLLMRLACFLVALNYLK